MWGYLSEFWNQLTTVVVEAGEYTASWFQGVGNAVAGAVGNLFDFALHFFNDVAVLIGWVGTSLKEMLSMFFLPLQYIFSFLKNLFVSAFSAPITPEHLYTFDNEILGVFNAIPYWAEVKVVLGISLSVVMLFFVLKT